jgi:hypothetical protein
VQGLKPVSVSVVAMMVMPSFVGMDVLAGPDQDISKDALAVVVAVVAAVLAVVFVAFGALLAFALFLLFLLWGELADPEYAEYKNTEEDDTEDCS